jgi:hypothetical protein
VTVAAVEDEEEEGRKEEEGKDSSVSVRKRDSFYFFK